MTNNNEFNSVDINKIIPASDKTGLKSMFEEGAYIDLGKGINTKWDEYKKDGDGKFFTLNKITNPLNGYDKLVKIDNNKDVSYTIDDIVKFTKEPGREQMVLDYPHFAYCSRLGFFPNTRLVTLRRFRGAVGDDIYQPPANYDDNKTTLKPISTMVTWLKDDESLFGSETSGFSFGISFSDYHEGFITTLKKSFNEYTGGSHSSESSSAPGWKDSLTNLALSSFIKGDAGVDTDSPQNSTLTKVDGTELGRSAANNPNMVGGAKRMDNLVSAIKFDLTFEYQMRYISGIDPTIAMLDLLSTAMHMGSNESEFRYNIKKFVGNDEIAKNFYKLKYNNTSAVAQSIMNADLKKIIEGTIDVAKKMFTGFIEKAGQAIENVVDATSSFITGSAKNKNQKVASLTPEIAKNIFDRYRESLKAAISFDTGLPSGGWHVMIGDPRNPFISCGDLVVGKTSMVKFGKELGPGGFPTSFSVSYNLEQARTRGRQEIMKIFNGGRGRIYTYKATKDNPDYGIFK